MTKTLITDAVGAKGIAMLLALNVPEMVAVGLVHCHRRGVVGAGDAWVLLVHVFGGGGGSGEGFRAMARGFGFSSQIDWL
mgnify:CR=1 FL=1